MFTYLFMSGFKLIRSKISGFISMLTALFITFSFVINAETLKEMDEVALSFSKAIKIAQEIDPWLKGSINQQRSIESMSKVAGSLPDPKVSISLANLPVNGFDFSQEDMTQARVGISQVLPRGDTLKIKSEQLKTQSEIHPHQRKNRKAQVAVTVGSLWLDAYRIQESIVLIEKNRELFEQLVDVSDVSYSSSINKTRQQDIVKAQLELTHLEDKLDELQQEKSHIDGQLLQWLINLTQERSLDNQLILDGLTSSISVGHILPNVDLFNDDLIYQKKSLTPNELVSLFTNHPSIIAIENKVRSAESGIKLAQQKYKPEWGVNTSYGYRADNAIGNSRADFFSIGLTFDLPLFTENKQDKEVQSAIYLAEAVKTEKILLLRKFIGTYKSAKERLLRFKKRQSLYQTKLLPQMHDQIEASISTYTNEGGDFSEVVRSRIAVLEAEVDLLTLNVEEQKLHLELNYLFTGSSKRLSYKMSQSVNNQSTIQKNISQQNISQQNQSLPYPINQHHRDNDFTHNTQKNDILEEK